MDETEPTPQERELGLVDDFDEEGILISMDRFVKCCIYGGFTNWDGIGNYASQDKMNIGYEVTPSDIIENNYDSRYTHVFWYQWN